MTSHDALPHVIVCGGRDFADQGLLVSRLDLATRDLGRIVVCTGACPTGADKLAEEWALARRHVVKRFHADWKEYGKAAGPLRNAEMATVVSGVPDGFCVAFWDGRSTGTKSCIDECKRRGIPTKIVRY